MPDLPINDTNGILNEIIIEYLDETIHKQPIIILIAWKPPSIKILLSAWWFMV